MINEPRFSAFRVRSLPRFRAPLLPVSLLAAGLLLGCTRSTPTPAADGGDSTTETAAASPSANIRPIDELTIALESVKQTSSENADRAAARARFYLNQWLSRTDFATVPWKRDPLLDKIPSSYQATPGLEELESSTFSGWPAAQKMGEEPWLREERNDLDYLQQALWLHDIVERVALPEPTPELKAWLQEVEKASGITVAEKLAKADRLFDWTVRNIQLDPLLPAPKPPVATADANEAERNWASLPAPMRGEPGPGYLKPVRKTLMLGHGDAWERARVFIHLCREAGINAVMLGLLEEASVGTRPWVVGVLLDKQLYLFDPELGLPIPGPDLTGIATLEQAVAQPGLLAQLNVTDGPAYPVQQEQLTDIVALVDAAPEALSKRMMLVESALKGPRHLALTVNPSQLEKQLRECKHIGNTSLWRVPLEAAMFQAGWAQLFARDPAMRWNYKRELEMFWPQQPLAMARSLQLQGVLENDEQLAGARTLYLGLRTPDREIDLLQTSQAMRRATGLADRLPDNVEDRNAMLDLIAFVARRAKQHATYWLALSYLESGKSEAAREWLEDRTLPATPASPWIPGATFNLARIYEQQGNIAKASELYRSTPESPQHHGNLLRAQWLEAKKEAGESTTTPENPDNEK